MTASIYKALAAALAAKQNPSLLTVTAGPKVGSKVLVGQGKAENSLLYSDPAEQAYWTEQLKQLDLYPSPRLISLSDGNQLFIQHISLQPKLYIFGGGHISLPLAELGKMLGFYVAVIDERYDFANKQRFTSADQVICQSFEKAVTEIEYLPDNYYVIVTRGHLYDRMCLEAVLQHPFAYVGMIGSRSKIKVVMNYMLANGYDQSLLDQVHSPVGLDIGAQTPAEIAVCIAAEIIQVKNQRLGHSFMDEGLLKYLQDPAQPAALVTIIEKTGSSPRAAGTQMLVLKDGSFLGTIGGGAAEKEAQDIAKDVIADGKPRQFVHDMTNADARVAGMVCGGKNTIFIEKI